MEASASIDSHVIPAPRRTRWLADVSLLTIAAVWGATFFMVKDAISAFPVMAFLAIRFTLASAVLLPLVIQARHKPTRAELTWGLVAGLLFCGGYVFQTFALGLIGSGRTGFITGLYVVMVPMLALILLRHKLTRRVILGTLLALVGLTLLSYAPGGDLFGDVLAFLCALSYALQILAVEKFPKGADWRTMALIQAGCVAVICTVLTPFFGPIPITIPLNVLAVAAFTGVIASAVALAVQVWAQRVLPPSDTALIFAMEAPFSALFGFLFKGERDIFAVNGLIGCTLILAGMLTTALGGEEISEHGKSEGTSSEIVEVV
jgi:drug/metabolite transporter (DMT)-like permease